MMEPGQFSQKTNFTLINVHDCGELRVTQEHVCFSALVNIKKMYQQRFISTPKIGNMCSVYRLECLWCMYYYGIEENKDGD